MRRSAARFYKSLSIIPLLRRGLSYLEKHTQSGTNAFQAPKPVREQCAGIYTGTGTNLGVLVELEVERAPVRVLADLLLLTARGTRHYSEPLWLSRKEPKE
jgi:hypothetical protein